MPPSPTLAYGRIVWQYDSTKRPFATIFNEGVFLDACHRSAAASLEECNRQLAQIPRRGGVSRLSDLERRRSVAAAAIGNVLEWYDFAIYAYAGQGQSASTFFPDENETASLLAAFATFGVGFS